MKYLFKNLVFEGGGVKGIAYGGALEVLNKKKLLSDIERVAGTSAGAINAALLALGFSSQEVSDIVARTNFNDFEDHSSFFPKNIYRLIKTFGWNKGDAFTDWIGELIKQKTGKTDFTFGELEESVKSKDNKDNKLLFTIATNLSKQHHNICSHETTPNVAIKHAVRMSMSIPLFFQAFKQNEEVFVDGGVSYNYPINLFDNKKYLSKEENKSKEDYFRNPNEVFNYETLGFRLDSKEVIEFAKRDWSAPPAKINNIKSYVGGLVNFMMEMANKAHLHKNDWNRTIFIDTLDVRTTDFDLKEDKVKALIKSGVDSTTKYFKWRDGDPVWSKLPK